MARRYQIIETQTVRYVRFVSEDDLKELMAQGDFTLDDLYGEPWAVERALEAGDADDEAEFGYEWLRQDGEVLDSFVEVRLCRETFKDSEGW